MLLLDQEALKKGNFMILFHFKKRKKKEKEAHDLRAV